MDYSLSNIWRLRVGYSVAVIVILFVQTLPASTFFLPFFAPDVILALTFALALRRPDVVKPMLVAALLLLSDFLLHRPPGAWAVIVLIAAMFLRSRSSDMREGFYALEWALVAAVMLACFFIYQATLLITFSGVQPMTLTAAQTLATIVIYPLITFALHRIFAVNKSIHTTTVKKAKTSI